MQDIRAAAKAGLAGFMFVLGLTPVHAPAAEETLRLPECGIPVAAKPLHAASPAPECALIACDVPTARDAFLWDSSRPPYVIPVAIHVLAEDDGSNPAATQAVVDAQMAQLNGDFALYGMQFVYTTRIVASTEYRFFSNPTFSNLVPMKEACYQTPHLQLNIIATELSNPPWSWGSGPTIGDPLSFRGGIVMSTNPLANQFTANLSRHTLTHEVGHIFGLWHPQRGNETFPCGSSCAENLVTGSGDLIGDFCADTPPQPISGSCTIGGTDACSGLPWPAIPNTNYMNSANTCKSEFTPQQTGRMHCNLTNWYTSWLNCADTTYHASSSNDSAGPSFRWISARDLGTRIPDADFEGLYGGSALDDGAAANRSVGFAFPFFGRTYTTVTVGVNGALSFTNSDLSILGTYAPLTIPGAPFGTFVAPFHTDLRINTTAYPEAGVYVYRSGAPDTLVIEWHLMESVAFPGPFVTFEAIFTSDADITFQYLDVTSSASSGDALVGIAEQACLSLSYFDGGSPATHQPEDSLAVAFETCLDQDGDGVCHDIDNCAAAYNPGQEDTDGDGLGDPCDPCLIARTGDVNESGSITAEDLILMVKFTFRGQNTIQPCQAAADVDCNGAVTAADIIQMVNFVFKSGDPPCDACSLVPTVWPCF